MASRGAAATLALHLMLVATLALAAATFMSTAEAGCSKSMAQQESNTTRGRFRHPEGGEDGIYMGSVEVDEQGVEQYRVKYLGPGNATLDEHGRLWAANNLNVSRAGGLGRKLLQLRDSGAHCQFNLLDPFSVLVAVTKVANHFGIANTLPAHGTFYAVDRCTIAYVCNYNGFTLWTNGIRIWADTMYISAACTVFSGGYYSRETSASASGRTYLGNDYC